MPMSVQTPNDAEHSSRNVVAGIGALLDQREHSDFMDD